MSESRPVRVLHTIGQLIPGGVELRTLELIKHTSSKNIEHVVCITSGREGTLDADYLKAGAKLVYLNIRSTLFAPRFYRLLKTHSVSVVHATVMYASGYLLAIARAAGVRNRIVHFRSDGEGKVADVFTQLKRHLLRFMIDSSATKIIGLTPKNLEVAWSPEWRRDHRCGVVSNGIEPGREPLVQASELEFLHNKTILVHAGRGDIPTKNREKAITVFARYRQKNPNSVLVFIGRDGRDPESAVENRRKWDSIVRENGLEDWVFFLGEKASVLPFFASADVLLFTSTLEGLPGVVLEALSVGLPVISSDVPGSKFIADHGLNIEILDAKDPDDSWADVLLRFDPKLKPTDRSDNIALFKNSPFNMSSAVEEYIKIWTT